jgi:hypothetical protein
MVHGVDMAGDAYVFHFFYHAVALINPSYKKAHTAAREWG